MSGGIRTSVKGHLNAQPLCLTGELNVAHGMNGGVNRNFSAPQASVGSEDKKKQQDYPLPLPPSEKRIASSSSGPIKLKSALKFDSYETRTRDESHPEDVPSTPRIEGEIKIRRFLFDELKTATWNFHPHNKLGEGGFGSVFKGWIDDSSYTDSKPGTGTLIAVKRINRQGYQGRTEWLAEIRLLGRLRHPNLVRLLGYCSEDNHEQLVYEFVTRGSLDCHLFGRASYLEPLSWNRRMKIALDVAKVVSFIHNDVGIVVIHGDLKSSNILLDSAYNAKLSDFGLARRGISHVSEMVIGTYGYAAPEYLATGLLSVKSDVYGFGVVMLEILSGRQVVDDSQPTGEQNLVDWARPLFASTSGVLKLFDTRLEGHYSVSAALKAAKLASRCLLLDPKSRPNMNEVAKALKQLQGSGDNERSRISQSEPRQSPCTTSTSTPSSNGGRSRISFCRAGSPSQT